MVNATNEFHIDTRCEVTKDLIRREMKSIFDFSMCSDEKLLQFLMSKDFTARYAGDDDQYEEERFLQERHQNIPPTSLIDQMVSSSFSIN